MDYGSFEDLEFESGLADLGADKNKKKYNKVTCSFSDAAFKALSKAAASKDSSKSQFVKAAAIDALKAGGK